MLATINCQSSHLQIKYATILAATDKIKEKNVFIVITSFHWRKHGSRIIIAQIWCEGKYFFGKSICWS